MKYTQKPRPSGDAHAFDRVAVLDIESHSPDFEDEGFPAWPLHRPICASILTADSYDDGVVSFSLTTIMFPNREVEALGELEKLLEGRALVTFNGHGFDIPVLALTAMKNRNFEASNLSSIWRANRYGGAHCDLADQFSQFSSARGASLATLCAALDIPVKTTVHGDEVGKLFDSGEIETIKQYCEEDVLATYLLFLNWIAFRHNDPDHLASGCASLARHVEAEGLEHLLGFAQFSRVAWAHQELKERMARHLIRDLKIATSRNICRPDIGIIDDDDDDEDQIPF